MDHNSSNHQFSYRDPAAPRIVKVHRDLLCGKHQCALDELKTPIQFDKEK
jgi:capsule polysaccharide export protein KpsC/LpsZ